MNDSRDSSSPPQACALQWSWRHLLVHTPYRRSLLFGSGLVVILIVVVLALLVRTFGILPIDLWTTQELQESHRRIVVHVMYAVSIFGYQPWAAITIGMGTLVTSRWLGWRTGGYVLCVTLLQGIINAAIKMVVGRPRPVNSLVDVIVGEHGKSFPSGHVMFYIVFFGMLCFLACFHLHRSWLCWLTIIACAIPILLVGISRMILGSHWLSDVIAAYLLGLLLLALSIEGYVTFLAPQTFAFSELSHPASRPICCSNQAPNQEAADRSAQ